MRQRLLLLLCVVVCLLAAVFAVASMVFGILFSPSHAHRVAVAFDQLANAGAGGDEDETISSRAAKAARRKRLWGCWLCRVLGWFDPGHCEKNIESDEGRPTPAA